MGLSLSISAVLNWHVIKESYMEKRESEWATETDRERERERESGGRYCIAVATAAIYIHRGSGSPLPKMYVSVVAAQ